MVMTTIVVTLDLNDIMAVMMNLMAEHHPSRQEIPPKNKQQSSGELLVFTSVMAENCVHNNVIGRYKVR